MGTASAIVFTRVFGLSLVLPGFAQHAGQFTSNQVLIGTALSAYGITLALMQFPLGILSDRIGRRPVLVVGTLLFVAGSAWAAVATSITTLIAARLLQGLGAVSSTAMAAVGETVPEERRTTAMAMIGVPAGLGFLLGLIAGAALLPSFGVPGLFWLTAGLGLAAGLPLLLLKWPAPIPNLAVAAAGDRRSLSVPVVGLALGGFAVNFALTTVIFFLPGIPLSHAGLAIVFGSALLLMAGLSRRIDKARSTWQPILFCLALLAIGAAFFARSQTGWIVAAGGVVFFTAHATLSAVLPSQVSRIAGRSGGRGHGIQTVVAYAGTAAAGPLAGYAVQIGHPAYAFVAIASAATIAAIVVVRGLRMPNAAPITVAGVE